MVVQPREYADHTPVIYVHIFKHILLIRESVKEAVICTLQRNLQHPSLLFDPSMLMIAEAWGLR